MKAGKKIKRFFKKRPLWKPLSAIVLAILVLVTMQAVLQSVKAEMEQEAREYLMSNLLLGGAPFREEEYTGEDELITAVYRGTGGCVVETLVDGYAAPIAVWVGVRNDGHVTGVTIRDMAETFGLGRNAMFDVDFLVQFLRTEGDAAVGEEIDAISGATVTSKAVTKAVNAAVGFVTGADVSSGATEWGG